MYASRLANLPADSLVGTSAGNALSEHVTPAVSAQQSQVLECLSLLAFPNSDDLFPTTAAGALNALCWRGSRIRE